MAGPKRSKRPAARVRVLRPPSETRFVVGMVLSVALPSLAGWIDSFSDWRLPSIPFTLAVVASAIVGRLLAGITAAVLSTVLVGYLVLDPQNPWFVDPVTAGNLAAFLVLALAVSWILARADAVSEQRRDTGASLSLAVRAGSLGTWRWETATGEVLWDAEVERIHGLPPGGFDGRYETYLSLQHPEDREEIAATVQRALAQRKGYRVVHRIVTPAGAVRWIEGFGEPVLDGRGEVVGLTGVVRDITAERLQELELERALRSAERLQTVAADLAKAATPEEVAHAVVSNGRLAMRADAALFYVVDGRGVLRLLAAEGYDDATLDAYREMTLDVNAPIPDAVRENRTLFLGTRAEIDVRYPYMAGRDEVPDRSTVTCPIASGGESIGAMFFAASRDAAFDAEDLPLLEAIASQTGVALSRARLLASERERREELDDLLSITDVTLSAFEFDELVDRLSERINAVLEVDATTLLLLTPDGRYLEEIHGVSGGPSRVAVGSGVAGKIVSSGEPLAIADLSTYEVARPWLARMASLLGVPITSRRGRIVGVLHVATHAPRSFTEADQRLLMLAAGRLASSLERTRLLADREQTSRVLQRSILPGELPEVPGLELDGLYVPYAPGEDVGGDFYDAFPVADGSYVLAIGDVSGKGAAAAAVMGFVRHSLRSVARFVSRPSDIVRELNRAMLEDSPTAGERFCTVVVVRVEPSGDRARLTLARAGHEMPLVVRRDGSIETLAEGGAPIGMWPDLVVSERSLELGRGDALILFTDGLVETPDVERRDELTELLRELAGASATGFVEALRARMVSASPTSYDDVAILVATKR